MAKKRKDIDSVVSFRISRNLSDKALKIINSCYSEQQLSLFLNLCAELYALLLSGGDVVGFYKNNTIARSKQETKGTKNRSDTVSFRLQGITQETLDIINEFILRNDFATFMNTAIEFYRVLSEAGQNNNSEPPQESKKDNISHDKENMRLSLRFLQNIQQ